ncbi:Kinesin-like protein [Parasponia andersonii]|uniref:Kinesin-like protein n=1 Tax=Parasponia andersonii TaxID=3476 RepID=A0A2P5A8D4_PARAD|nr:Kinesin-like protein [Parasponia andersonii]
MASALRSSTTTTNSSTGAGGGGGGGYNGNNGRSDKQQQQQVSSSSSSSYSYSRGGGGGGGAGVHGRPKAPSSRRSVTPNSRTRSTPETEQDSERVRVAVRLRPKNAEDLIPDSDFADCVELQPELKRLKLRKNNWSSESYRFDEVFTDTASQRRVYEAVAKPVVESVLSGYNGTVMAYGQTGTGKTYTVGRMGKDDTSERGIMARALEDILSSTSPAFDSVEISYLQLKMGGCRIHPPSLLEYNDGNKQLYLESIQDLLAPEKINIPIYEDPKTSEVSLPGASVVKVQDLDHFLQLLQIGEANRHAANTKLNTESSRSHAILIVNVRRPVHENVKDGLISQEKVSSSSSNGIPIVRKSKLLIVDLAGSERVDKSGSEGHMLEEAKFINSSLTSLGKCINALAENSSHIPFRDSKLTRLLRDSFGGSARTSLIITIGPSARHYVETTSTIMFGQRAIKIINTVKLKEDFDYESLCRKLENQVDLLTAEVERQQKLREADRNELEKELRECQDSFSEAKKNLITRSEFLEKENTRLELEVKDILTELNCQQDQNELMRDKVAELEVSLKHSKQNQLESSTYQKVLVDTTQMYEKKMAELTKQLKDEHAHAGTAEEQLAAMKKLLNDSQKTIQKLEMDNSRYQKELAETTQMYENRIAELSKQVKDEHIHSKGLKEQLDSAKKLLSDHQSSMQDQKEIEELEVKLQEMYQLHEQALDERRSMKTEYKGLLEKEATITKELLSVRQRLLVEEKQRKTVEDELVKLKRAVPENENDFEDKKLQSKENIGRVSSRFGSPTRSEKSNPQRDTLSGQRATIAKICEEVGLQKILQLLTSEDSDVQIQAVKVVANLAAEDINQEKIVEEGGLDALLVLLRSSQNTTILRVTSGAIANLAMNEMNQGLIISKGGAQLLAKIASKSNDPQTLRMVAGALANLCGNESLHTILQEDGGIKALLGMVRCGSNDVIAQIARGLANFSKCETRGIIQGYRKGRSLLVEDDALSWLIANSNTSSTSTKRHIELALCHLAQNEDNARDFISSGGVKELVRISMESSKDDIRNLAKKTLRLNPAFQAEMQKKNAHKWLILLDVRDAILNSPLLAQANVPGSRGLDSD